MVGTTNRGGISWLGSIRKKNKPHTTQFHNFPCKDLKQRSRLKQHNLKKLKNGCLTYHDVFFSASCLSTLCYTMLTFLPSLQVVTVEQLLQVPAVNGTDEKQVIFQAIPMGR